MKIIERTDTPPNGKATVWWNAVEIPPPWEGGAGQKDLVKGAGFWFDGDRPGRIKRNAGTTPTMTWWTDKFENVVTVAAAAREAGKFAEVFPSTTLRDRLDAEVSGRAEALDASRAADADLSDLSIPLPAGRELFPFQRAGVRYIVGALARTGGCLIGDEMGLGKTPQAIASINALPDVKTVLIVCPKVAMMVWQRHCEQWLTRRFRVIRMQPGGKWPQQEDDRGLVVIINFDIVSRYRSTISGVDLLIVDEAHFLKNPKAQRTQAVFGTPATRQTAAVPGIATRYRMALTGTPIPNRPVELWPILSWLDPRRWNPGNGFFTFARRYCDANDASGHWDFSGASNLAELQQVLRSTIMVRRLKADVLTELPAKMRQVVELDGGADIKALLKREHEAFEKWEANGRGRVAFDEMSEIRHEVGLAKIPYIIEHLRGVLEERGKIGIFGWHRDVLAAYAKAFPGSVMVTGDTSTIDRERFAQRFQTDPSCNVFIGNMQAAGTAITLTASSYVAFAEEDWTPGTISQVEDRFHRIGQRDSVLAQHFVFADSLDARMIEVVIGKQRVADAALDAHHEPVVTPAAAPIAWNVEPPAKPARDPLADPFDFPRETPPATSNGRQAREMPLPEGKPGLTPLLPGTAPFTRSFLLGGKSYFTISDESGAWHYTYRVGVKKDADKPWFVKVLTGPNNRTDYSYAGVIHDPATLEVYSSAKSLIPSTAPSMQVLKWALRHLREGRALPDGYAIRHMGRCGCCARKLSTPESIDRGLGPECASRVGW